MIMISSKTGFLEYVEYMNSIEYEIEYAEKYLTISV